MDTQTRFQVLQLAHNQDDAPDKVVERATAYSNFVEPAEDQVKGETNTPKEKSKKEKKH